MIFRIILVCVPRGRLKTSESSVAGVCTCTAGHQMTKGTFRKYRPLLLLPGSCTLLLGLKEERQVCLKTLGGTEQLLKFKLFIKIEESGSRFFALFHQLSVTSCNLCLGSVCVFMNAFLWLCIWLLLLFHWFILTLVVCISAF